LFAILLSRLSHARVADSVSLTAIYFSKVYFMVRIFTNSR